MRQFQAHGRLLKTGEPRLRGFDAGLTSPEQAPSLICTHQCKFAAIMLLELLADHKTLRLFRGINGTLTTVDNAISEGTNPWQSTD